MRDKGSNCFVIPANNHKGCAGPGSSPVVVLNNTTGWIPARATARCILSPSKGRNDETI